MLVERAQGAGSMRRRPGRSFRVGCGRTCRRCPWKWLRGDESAPLGQTTDVWACAGTVTVEKFPQQLADEGGIVYLVA